jgi:hypothetical protein
VSLPEDRKNRIGSLRFSSRLSADGRRSWFVAVYLPDQPTDYLGPNPLDHEMGYPSLYTAMNVAMQWVKGRGLQVDDFAFDVYT